MSIVSVQHTSKSYDKGNVIALQDISLDVEQGELFGLIGPDGAGKTSLFRIMTSLLLADSGTVKVNGIDVVKDYKAVRQIIGYMPGKFSLYQDLTVEENLHFFATVFGTSISENYHLIKDIYSQIEMFKDRPAGKLSGGMKQKLALSCALIHKPIILFLDEPTTGVDPVSRKELWAMLKQLKAQGITIIVSTPYMDEASLCDRIALIEKGKILSVNTIPGIQQEYKGNLYSVKGISNYRIINLLQRHPTIYSAYAFGETVHVNIQQDFTKEQLTLLLSKEQIIDITEIEPNIEDCFIQLLQN